MVSKIEKCFPFLFSVWHLMGPIKQGSQTQIHDRAALKTRSLSRLQLNKKGSAVCNFEKEYLIFYFIWPYMNTFCPWSICNHNFHIVCSQRRCRLHKTYSWPHAVCRPHPACGAGVWDPFQKLIFVTQKNWNQSLVTLGAIDAKQPDLDVKLLME